MKLELIKALDAIQTIITVFSTDEAVMNEKLYVIVSRNKFTNEEYVRYGNETQMNSIINSYGLAKEFKL